MDWAKADQLVDDLAWLDSHDALEGAKAIITERRRQIEVLGYTIWHDQEEHPGGELARAAHSRLGGSAGRQELAEAGALAAAEIDRLGSGGPEA